MAGHPQHSSPVFPDSFSASSSHAISGELRQRTIQSFSSATVHSPNNAPHRPTANYPWPSNPTRVQADHAVLSRRTSMPVAFTRSMTSASEQEFDRRCSNIVDTSNSTLAHRHCFPDPLPPDPHLPDKHDLGSSRYRLPPINVNVRPPPPLLPTQSPAVLLSQLDAIITGSEDWWDISDTANPLSEAGNRTSSQVPALYRACRDKIDVEALLNAHDIDRQVDDRRVQMEREDVEGASSTRTLCWRKPMCMVDVQDFKYRVFGQPLHLTRMYASCVASMAGYQHDLPIVVFACVEELYRTGMTTPGLFRTAPDRTRHGQLIDLFDFGPSFGHNVTLAKEATADVCAMLRTYIDRLPEPLLHPALYDAFWTWCVLPSTARDKERMAALEQVESHCGAAQRVPSALLKEDADASAEATQIAVARTLFRLLPAAQFSLLAYLCAFFTQLPLSPRNLLGHDDVARLFAEPLLGRAPGRARDEARAMLVWILRRWALISEDLFECEGEGGDADEREPFTPSPSDECASVYPSSPASRWSVSTLGSDHDVCDERQGDEILLVEDVVSRAEKAPAAGDTEAMLAWKHGVEGDLDLLQEQLTALRLKMVMK